MFICCFYKLRIIYLSERHSNQYNSHFILINLLLRNKVFIHFLLLPESWVDIKLLSMQHNNSNTNVANYNLSRRSDTVHHLSVLVKAIESG